MRLCCDNLSILLKVLSNESNMLASRIDLDTYWLISSCVLWIVTIAWALRSDSKIVITSVQILAVRAVIWAAFHSCFSVRSSGLLCILSFSFRIFDAAGETLIVSYSISCFFIFSSFLKYHLKYCSHYKWFFKELRYHFSMLADLHKNARSWDNMQLINDSDSAALVS